MSGKILFATILCFVSLNLQAQDHRIWKSDIDTIEKLCSPKAGSPDLIVFTGSSNIRMWDNLEACFPGKNIINTGFGGSQMGDLLYYAKNTILKYKPVKVFIYEGDNDLATGRKPSEIISKADSLIGMIHNTLPSTKIIFLSAKPSPSRWQLRDKYNELNRLYSQLPSRFSYVKFVDLWTPLIGKNGRPTGMYYKADSLHLNHAGYSVWTGILGKEL